MRTIKLEIVTATAAFTGASLVAAATIRLDSLPSLFLLAAVASSLSLAGLAATEVIVFFILGSHDEMGGVSSSVLIVK